MKKQVKTEDYEQLTIDFGDDICITEESASSRAKDEVKRNFEVGAKVTVNQDVKRFCDGRGIPDYARTAHIKRINEGNTIVIESEPNGKEFGLLFASDISLVL